MLDVAHADVGVRASGVVACPAMFRRGVGAGSLYWLGLRDATGAYLDGGRTCRLRVPPPVPYSLFWSVTAHDVQTRSEVVADQDRAALRSLFEALEPEGSDHVDLWFGPQEPDGAGGRWIQTVPGRGWFAYFRIHGPQQAAFDGSWKPGDFEQQHGNVPHPHRGGRGSARCRRPAARRGRRGGRTGARGRAAGRSRR
ncbi:DUF1214 domain-containing protein [Streptomyces flaveolus]|uniref:DUF1214 domain-containing protein n=1 Tax=Streptomyces flaveolus TaxID=67297 RepID=UPI0019930D3E|nr:DUF1214 domain-containing protein [Streptomyces flaveolus]GGQ85815.1 hypothetical protein GCM10010216_54680 [Streptomyces flaveolus]